MSFAYQIASYITAAVHIITLLLPCTSSYRSLCNNPYRYGPPYGLLNMPFREDDPQFPKKIRRIRDEGSMRE